MTEKDKPFSRLDVLDVLGKVEPQGHRFRPEVILASKEKADLVAGIEDAVYRRCYAAWIEYHHAMENIDRLGSHMPSRNRRSKEVIPMPRTVAIKEAYKRLDEERRALTCGAPEEIHKEARRNADRDFTKELRPCECSVCKEAR
jgi:hypothetical protein